MNLRVMHKGNIFTADLPSPITKLTEKSLGFDRLKESTRQNILWDSRQFDLHKSHHFLKLSPSIRQNLLEDLNKGLLSEAYYIELAGMAFAGKMNSLARNTEERIFYSLMSAEEAQHFAMLRPYLCKPEAIETQYFAQFIGNIIADGEFASLNILIQVILEGWGLYHYNELQNFCQSPSLTKTLKKIVKDEARHHGCGLLLAKNNYLNKKEENFVFETLVELLQAVRVGPQVLMATLKKYEVLPKTKTFNLLDEIQAMESTQLKLLKLKSIITPVVTTSILAKLENLDLWKPVSLSQMVNSAS